MSIVSDKDFFMTNGYLLLKNVLAKSQISSLSSTADYLWDKHRDYQEPGAKLELDSSVLGEQWEILDLVDNRAVLDVVYAVMGPNIKVSYFGLMVNPPQSFEKKAMDYHQDGGRVNFDMNEISSRPMLSMKAAYWLTDGTEIGRGNFCLIPRSQGIDKLRDKSHPHPDEKIFLVSAGDVILFDRRVWHARKANHSLDIRKVLFYDYTFRWMENKSIHAIPKEFLEKFSDLKQQLLLNETNLWKNFATKDENLPLNKLNKEI